jgi:hypothetical protein
MDNYFTSIPLFTELRTCQYRAMGTTRPHKEFPSSLKELKERFSTKLKWNTLIAKVIDNTLCLAWQDNNIVLALSNIHTINRTEDFREKVRKRPVKRLQMDGLYDRYLRTNLLRACRFLVLLTTTTNI